MKRKLTLIVPWLILFFIFMLGVCHVRAQQPWHKYAPLFGASVFKGGVDATLENLHFRPGKVAKFYGVAREDIDPAETWVRKWKNGDPNQGEAFPLSSSLLVFFTDPYHKIRTLNNFTGLYLPVLYPDKQTNLDKFLIIPAVQFVGQAVGFSIMESLYKKQRP